MTHSGGSNKTGTQILICQMCKSTYKYLVLILVVITASFIISKYFQIYRVREDSMYPTFNNGDLILTLKTSRERLFTKGSVIVFQSPSEFKLLIKRIVLVPSDTIYRVKSATPLINGKNGCLNKIQNFYSSSEIKKMENIIDIYVDITRERIPYSYYYVLGDNANKSLDSRFFGLISKDQIVGKVVIVLSAGSIKIARSGKEIDHD